MNKWKVPEIAVALLLISPSAVGQTVPGGPEVDATKGLVAMIECNLNDASAQGAGIVFAVDRNWTYLATAYHLVKRCDLRATGLKIRLWHTQETFQAEIYDDKNSCDCDLAVLRVKALDAPFEFRR